MNRKMERVRITGILLIFIIFISTLAPSAWAATKIKIRKIPEIPVYNQLSQWKFSSQNIAVPPEGITFSRENATWKLISGYIRLMEPTADGRVTGLIFKGQGRFTMTVPHWVEREHLGRCSGKKNLDHIDEAFETIVLRTTGPIIGDMIATPPPTAYAPDDLAAQRHEVWIRRGWIDVDARVVMGLFNPADEYLRVAMDTKTFGWLSYVFDKNSREEIKLIKYRRKYNFEETWVSLDRASHRKLSGAPGPLFSPAIDILRHDIEANMSRVKMSTPAVYGARKLKTAIFNTMVTFVSNEQGLRMIELSISPRARIKSVRSGSGKALAFLRRKSGQKVLVKKNKNYVGDFHVLLEKPCSKGETRKITVYYQMDIGNFVTGGSWYPGLKDNFNDRHMVYLTARLPKALEFRAVGKKISETVEGKLKISVWQSAEPCKIYGFTLGRRYDSRRLSHEGVPDVVSFGTEGGFSTGDMIRNVGVDIINSLRYFSAYFNVDFPYKEVFATAIDSGHGQAFQGFLHLSRFTYRSESPGASELFRAHETAHLLWGHMVGWKTYRDQWLSEAFAEYTAMMYIQAVAPKKKYFEDILDAYTNELKGSIKTMFSKYSRNWEMVKAKRIREKMGPISIGRRASTADAPVGYQIQVYDKGALVLHMLRMLLRNAKGNDELFRTIMSDFLLTYRGKDASTDDFKAIIEKHTNGKWSWFFDQWIHGTAIPTYRWNHKITKKDGKTYNMAVTVKQRDVPEGFGMPVPLRVIFKDKSVRQFVLPIRKPEQTFNLTFQKKIKKVIFNPDYAVLAKVKGS